jgi:hypothetical protein
MNQANFAGSGEFGMATSDNFPAFSLGIRLFVEVRRRLLYEPLMEIMLIPPR